MRRAEGGPSSRRTTPRPGPATRGACPPQQGPPRRPPPHLPFQSLLLRYLLLQRLLCRALLVSNPLVSLALASSSSERHLPNVRPPCQSLPNRPLPRSLLEALGTPTPLRRALWLDDFPPPFHQLSPPRAGNPPPPPTSYLPLTALTTKPSTPLSEECHKRPWTSRCRRGLRAPGRGTANPAATANSRLCARSVHDATPRV